MISLKLIENQKDIDLNKGIRILYKYIPVDLCIDSNELSYWIGNYNNKFNDKMYCFVIKKNDTVIGWLQFTHFIDKFIFLDYLIVEKEYRNSKTMKDIYCMIKYESEKLKCKSVVLECGFEMNQHDAIVRLYRIFGFKEYNINYIEPKINIDLFNKNISWSEIPSILMHNDDTLDIYDVIKTIYFNHYLRWYSLYEFDMLKYKMFLNETIDKILK